MRKKKNIDCIVGDAGSAMTKTKQTVELMAKKIWRTKWCQTICNFQSRITILKLSFHDVNGNLKEIEKNLAYGIYWMY